MKAWPLPERCAYKGCPNRNLVGRPDTASGFLIIYCDGHSRTARRLFGTHRVPRRTFDAGLAAV